MARMSAIERTQAPWHLRWFYTATRRMFGKELTPIKLQVRVPRVVWPRSWSRHVSPADVVCRSATFSSGGFVPPRASDAPSEWTSTLPSAERLVSAMTSFRRWRAMICHSSAMSKDS